MAESFDMQEWMYSFVQESKEKLDDGTFRVEIAGDSTIKFETEEEADDFLWAVAPDEYNWYMTGVYGI